MKFERNLCKIWKRTSFFKHFLKGLINYPTASMKISILMNISLTRFYGYIGTYRKISMDILTQNMGRARINQNPWKCGKKKL